METISNIKFDNSMFRTILLLLFNMLIVKH